MFLSLVRPESISSPITSTAAVTISDGALGMAVIKSLDRTGRTPSVAPSTAQVTEPTGRGRPYNRGYPRPIFRQETGCGLVRPRPKYVVSLGLYGFFLHFSWPEACRLGAGDNDDRSPMRGIGISFVLNRACLPFAGDPP